MNRSTLLWCLFVGFLGCLPSWAKAQDGDATLHILRPLIHADREKAEICLEFDHVLDKTSHARIVAAVHLENEGKSQAQAPQNISLDGNNLCVLNLEHQHNYRITVAGVRGEKGEKLSETYGLSFTVPDRHPSVAFINTTSDNGLIRWHDNNPMLRTVNMGLIHVELYRITEIAAMGDAWRQRLQTTLAPSESVYFAKHNGQLIAQQDVELKTIPNKDVEQDIKLNVPSSDLGPGLYLVVASEQPLDDKPKKKKKSSLAPMAAQWLLRSELVVRAIQGKGGYYILTERKDPVVIEPGLRVMIQDQNQKIVVEGRSDASGVTFLPLSAADKNNGTTLIGVTEKGEVAFADIKTDKADAFVLPSLDATLIMDKNFYAPGAPIHVALGAHDIHGQLLPMTKSFLQIQRPDHSIYSSHPVPDNQKAPTIISMTAPSLDELWILSWVQSDGTVIAQTPLHVTSNKQAPHFEMEADHPMLPDDGEANILIKSLGNDGRPIPYLKGEVSVQWIVPDTFISVLKEYTFGWREPNPSEKHAIATFITDDKGVAHISALLKPPAGAAPLRAAFLTVAGDHASGIVGSSSLTLYVRPKNDIVGVKAETLDNQFSENSLARFSVIAVDANGKRQDVDELSYRILEEGRQFDWYPSDGRWDYKPLRQERRLGGAPFSISANDENIIEWPVTAGDYRLEITDAEGALLAQMNFSAGWGKSTKDLSVFHPLPLTSDHELLRVGQTETIHFNLPKPSLVTVVLADDSVREVQHVFKSEGENTIHFTPQQDWGTHLHVSINAVNVDLRGQSVLPLQLAKQTLPALPKTFPAVDVTPLAADADIPSILKVNDSVVLLLDLKNNSLTPYHYTLTSSPGLVVSDLKKDVTSLGAGQHKTISLSLKATQAGDQFVLLDATDAHGNNITRRWPIAIASSQLRFESKEMQKLGPQNTLTYTAPVLSGNQQQSLFIMSIPVQELPHMMSTFLKIKPFRTRDIAQWLEVFHAWQPVLISSGLMTSEASSVYQQERLLQLLARQDMDGGFASMPGQSSDLASTTEALRVLGLDKNDQTQPAFDQAVGWMRHYLENGWFDETERPLRAASYAALATVQHLDTSSLYYFADNTKALPALAAAQLAQAFMAINDRTKAQYWMSIATQESGASMALDIQKVLASNSLTTLEEISSRLEKIQSAELKDIAKSPNSLMDFLQTVVTMNDRSSSWHVAINGIDQKSPGLWIEDVSEKPITIRNISKKILYVLSVSKNEDKALTSSIRRRLFLPNGIEVTGPQAFDHDKTYIMVLEGNSPKDARGTITLHDEASALLSPISCAFNNELSVDNSLSWIKQLSLTPVTACEVGGHGIHAQLNLAQAAAQNMNSISDQSSELSGWRLAYLVKAEWSGNVNLSSPVLSP